MSDPVPAPAGAVLAVDVGGTTVKAEVVAPDGAVLAAGRRPTAPGAATVEVVAGLGAELTGRSGATLAGAGVVVPGLIDAAAGVALWSTNIGWRDLPVTEPLAERWGVPVRLGHDCAAAAVAELRLGSARDATHACVVVVGTGIAAVQVADGAPVTGPRGEVAELGHIAVPSGLPCACGGERCLETVASASAIARRYTERSGRPTDGASDVVRRLSDDPAAAAVWDDAVTALADALTTMCTLTSPQVVVVGGGLGEAGAVLTDPLGEALRERLKVAEVPQVRAAALGARGGLVGAALLARTGWTP